MFVEIVCPLLYHLSLIVDCKYVFLVLLSGVTDATSQENELPVPVSKSLPARVGGGTTPTGEACPGQQEYGEKLSLGGESMNSAEFETISLIEETGKE